LTAPLHSYRCAKSPDEPCIVAQQAADGKQLTFAVLDPINGRGRELARFTTDPGADYEWDISPDGNYIAIKKNSELQLHILALDGKPPRTVATNTAGALTTLNWASDGKGLFTCGPVQRGVALLYVDLTGKTYPLWEARGAELVSGIPSPNGRHLAISASNPDRNVWMVENF
jgi:dipeptidyl aminopeptidase/acylaminoacyl peptidase